MINQITYIPENEQTHMFARAAEKCSFAQKGYEEEEYFFSGKANIYERVAGLRKVRYANAPYMNRMIIRKPVEVKKFSGNIIVEILNSTSDFDIDRVWFLCRNHFMRNGDIYVGITSKPNAIAALKKFDPGRYGELDWKNPLRYDIAANDLGNLASSGMPSAPESEDGLFWDMLVDAARVLRSDIAENPLAEYVKRKKIFAYLAGWSQSGGYIIRYIRDFADAEGKNLFDGYFSCGSVSYCTPNLNQEDAVNQDPAEKRLPILNKPMIEMHTESDNAFMGNELVRDNDPKFYRVYDLVGPSHDTTTSMAEGWYASDEDLLKLGSGLLTFSGTNQYPNSFPYEFAYQAAFEKLCQWVRNGIEPMASLEISIDEKTLKNITDESGNAVGGYRLPLINLPLCRYYSWSDPASDTDAFSCALYGHEEPYAIEELRSRYKDAKTYGKMIRENALESVKNGTLLEEDVDAFIAYAIDLARKFGL